MRGAELHLLYVPSEGDGRPPPNDDGEALHPVIEDALRSGLGDAFRPANPRVHFRMGARIGRPERAIASYASRNCADLIVVEGEYGATRGWRGHRSARMLGRIAPCAVLVMPTPVSTATAAPTSSFGEILCAIDFDMSATPTIEAALRLLRRYGGRITLLHTLQEMSRGMVFSGAEMALVAREYAGLAAAARGDLLRMIPANAFRRAQVERVVGSGLPHQRILQTASETNADLIVLGMTRRTRLDEIVNGSTSRAVLRRAICPVLLVPTSKVAAERETALAGWRPRQWSDMRITEQPGPPTTSVN
jgi:nucleotide-binding universal stress UspA family protein